jgi:hypothetical protein
MAVASVTTDQILQAYRDTLGRTPGPEEVNFWVNYSTTNDPTQTANAFLAGAQNELASRQAINIPAATSSNLVLNLPTRTTIPEPANVGTVASATGPVRPVAQPSVTSDQIVESYTKYLNRTPSADEVSFWTNYSTTNDPTQTAEAFLAGAKNEIANVTKSGYESYLGRTPNQEELNFWTNYTVEQGAPQAAAAWKAGADQELAARNVPSSVTEQQILDSYNKFFNRTPSADEVSFWVNYGRTADPTQTANAFINSARKEIGDITKSGYESYLGREPSQDELDFWTNYTIENDAVQAANAWKAGADEELIRRKAAVDVDTTLQNSNLTGSLVSESTAGIPYAGGIYKRTPQEEVMYAKELSRIPVSAAVPLPVMPMSLGPSAAMARIQRTGEMTPEQYYSNIRESVSSGQYTPAQLRQMQQNVGTSSQDINIAMGTGMTPISTTAPTLPGATTGTTQSIDQFIQSRAPTTSVAMPTAPSMFSPENVRAQLELERLRLQPTPEPPPEEPVAGFAQGGLVGDDINRMLQNQRNAIQRESQSRQMLTNLGAPPVKKFSDGGPAGSSSGVRRLKMSGYQEGGEVSKERSYEEMHPRVVEEIERRRDQSRMISGGVRSLLKNSDAKSSTAQGLVNPQLLTDPYSDAEGYVIQSGSIKDEYANQALPDEIFLRKNVEDPALVLSHEANHILARKQLGYPTAVNQKFDELIEKRGAREKFVRDAADAYPYLKEKYGVNAVYFQPKMLKIQEKAGKLPVLLYEQIATLAAIEDTQGVDLTKDPVLRKTLFKDRNVRETYNALTGLRMTRMDRHDIKPMTRVPEKGSEKEAGLTDRIKKMLGFSEGGDVSNDEFIQEMLTGTRPEDFPETSPVDTAVSDFISSRSKLVTDPQEFFRVMGENIKQQYGDINNDPKAMEAFLMDNLGFGGLTAYHASGKMFKQLDPSKAKSGVGEQRYGTGAGYTAESRPVAESFMGAEAQALRASGALDPKLEFVYDLVSQKRSDMDVLDAIAAKYGKKIGFDEAQDILKKAKSMTQGYLYKGDIPDEIIPSFLDWNKSLKQQTAEVKKLLSKDPLVKESVDPANWREVSGGIIQKGEGGLDDLTGDSIYKYISLKLGSDFAATDYLDKLGVRGIRYADPGSKGLGREPSGTSNFVVFRPEDYRIESVNDVPVGKTVSSPKAFKQVFEQVDKLPTNQLIDEVMSAHIGGVGDFGDETAKYYLSQIPGGADYIKASQELAKKNLGNQFMAYRLMPKDQFEALQAGDVGDLLSFSLSQSSAEALKKFVKNEKRGDLVVAEVPLTPEHVVAFGSPSEQEVIIDTGVGWSLDQFRQAAPLKKAKGGEVTNDEFIQEMMTGTRPTDETTSPGILPPEIRQAVDVPLDFANLLIRGTAAVPIGGVAGLYKGLTGGKYGTQEGVKEADTEAARMMAKITGEPKTQAAKDVLEFIGGKAQEYKLDAALPQLLTLPSPGPGAASALMRSYELAETPPLGTVKLAGDKGVKPATPPTDQMGFYSPAEKAVMGLPQDKGTASQMLAQITKTQGVKPVELRATGLEDYLKGKGNEPVTKQEIQDFLTNNRVQVDEVVLGKGQTLSPEAKKLSGEALSRMEEVDDKLASYFEGVEEVAGQDPYSAFIMLRSSIGRRAAKGDQEALDELNAFNLPPEIKDLVLEFGRNKNEYIKYTSQARKMEKPKFDGYNTSGGTNAREIYLTLPGEQMPSSSPPSVNAQGVLVKPMYATQPKFTAPSPHSVSPEADANRLAHIFLDERKDAKGNNVLFVQEMQSDWAQQGRDKGFAIVNKLPEGYSVKQDLIVSGQPWGVVDKNGQFVTAGFHRSKEDAVAEVIQRLNTYKLPTAPFVTNTEDWVNLALKRVIKEAVDNDIDTVAFIKGGQAADKYSLRTFVDHISADRGLATGDDLYVSITPKDSLSPHAFYVGPDGIIKEPISADVRSKFLGEPLSKVIGKETAEKLLSTKIGESQVLRDEGLTLGGKGMEGFYDNILPKTAEKLLKKLGGGKVEPVEMVKAAPSQMPYEANAFLHWMSFRHPGTSRSDAARAWGMGMDNNQFVKEFYEETTPKADQYLGFKITPEMKEMVKTEGLPKFAAGGEVTDFIKRAA